MNTTLLNAQTEDQWLEQGVCLIPFIINSQECIKLTSLVCKSPSLSGGDRGLLEQAWCQELAHTLKTHSALSVMIPSDYVATQCTYFEKSTSTNWLVPWHQDLSIQVKQRIEHPALSGWSYKPEGLFVSPPLGVLEQLIAVRLHLDDCLEEDGALKVLPNSHRLGKLLKVDRQHYGNEVLCTMQQGGALMMRPLLLHASSKATGDSLRRVLHFVFGPKNLPLGLEWQVMI